MTVTLIEYAVRVRGTNKYLPRPQRRDGRGGSHLEPVDFADRSSWPRRYAKDMQIRSYTTKANAQRFLTSWLKGRCYVTDYEYGDYETRPQPHRRAEDMEIVPIRVILDHP